MFLHKLALRMGRTVGELSASLTREELARWYAFNQTSPIGDERIDYLFARLCLLVSQIGGGKKKSGGAFTLDDFLMFKPKAARTDLDVMRSRFGHLLKRKT